MNIEVALEQIINFMSRHRQIIIGLTIIVFMFLIAKLTRIAIRKYFQKYQGENFDKTNYQFLNNGISFIFFILTITLVFYIIPPLRALGLTLFAGAGIIAAIIGFASQAAFSNIISGIFIVIFKPFRIGDFIKLESLNWGSVEDITLRHTVIKSFQNERYVIPNSKISAENILNASISDEKSCTFLEMGISYDSDIDLAIDLMREEAEKHPNLIDNRSPEDIETGTPKVVIRLIGFGDSSVNLRAYIWAEDFIKGFIMKTDLFKSIKKRFDAEGIEIPFPYRTIVYKDAKETKFTRNTKN